MGTPIWRGTSALIEQANSPKWTFGEQIQLDRIFKGPYAVCLASAPGYGAIGTGVATGLRVRESTVTRERGSIGMLVITFEPFRSAPLENIPLPEDTEELRQDHLEYALEKHELFKALTSQDLSDIKTVLETSWEDKDHQPAVDRINRTFAAQQLLAKKQKGTTHYFEFPPVYVRKSYTWVEPSTLNGGGVIETPNTVRISLPAGFKFLRQADTLAWNGTHFELKREWIGSQDIDSDLYK